jgi:hypothetical protein
VAIGRLIEDRHRAKIETQLHNVRRRAGLIRQGKDSDITNEPVAVFGQSDRAAARAVGLGRTTYYRAKRVVAAAEADPEQYGDLPEQMDQTGNVLGAAAGAPLTPAPRLVASALPRLG